jgi:hypothetical protein
MAAVVGFTGVPPDPRLIRQPTDATVGNWQFSLPHQRPAFICVDPRSSAVGKSLPSDWLSRLRNQQLLLIAPRYRVWSQS